MSRTLLASVPPPFNFDSLSGLVLELDPRNLAPGAVTSWTDQKFGDVFAGTATRDAAINGTPTVTYNGTSNILQLAAWARLNGATALTMVGAFVRTAAITSVMIELGHTGTNPGSWAWYCAGAGQAVSYALGSTGPTAGTVSDALATPAVWSTRVDFGLATNEAGNIRKNGVASSVTNGPNGNNTASAFATGVLALGSRSGGLPWAGSMGGKIVMYSRSLTDGEVQQAERAVGLLSNIVVA